LFVKVPVKITTEKEIVEVVGLENIDRKKTSCYKYDQYEDDDRWTDVFVCAGCGRQIVGRRHVLAGEWYCKECWEEYWEGYTKSWEKSWETEA